MEVELYAGNPPETGEPAPPPPDAGSVKEGEVKPPEFKHIKVRTAKELQSALDKAVSGTWIELQQGSYEQNGPFVIKDKHGTAAYPIRVTAAKS